MPAGIHHHLQGCHRKYICMNKRKVFDSTKVVVCQRGLLPLLPFCLLQFCPIPVLPIICLILPAPVSPTSVSHTHRYSSVTYSFFPQKWQLKIYFLKFYLFTLLYKHILNMQHKLFHQEGNKNNINKKRGIEIGRYL